MLSEDGQDGLVGKAQRLLLLNRQSLEGPGGAAEASGLAKEMDGGSPSARQEKTFGLGNINARLVTR